MILRDAWRRAVSEGVGTCFLVLIGPGAALVDVSTGGSLGPVGISLAFAFVVTAMVFALGHISGAHINPAVTLAFWSVRRIPPSEAARYVVAQLLGAIAGAVVLRFVVGPIVAHGATLPHVGVFRALVLEGMLSFVLMLVIMAAATDDRVSPAMAPLAIGLTVGFCALLGGPLTGASMNPARSFGPAVVAGAWHSHWVYWIAPIGGMIAAAGVYGAFRPVSARGSDTRDIIGVQGAVG